MQEILEKLNRIRGVGGSLVVSADGLPMVTALRTDADEAGISAAIGGFIENAGTVSERLGLGKTKALQATAASGAMLMIPAGPAFLVIVIDPSANMALLQLEARPFAERLAQRLSL